MAFAGTLAFQAIQGNLTLFAFEKSVEYAYDDVRYDKLIGNLDSYLDADNDKVELTIHAKCTKGAIAKVRPHKSDDPDDIARLWPRHGKGIRINRLAEYVACTIGDTPTRFCKAPARKRLEVYLRAYFTEQAIEESNRHQGLAGGAPGVGPGLTLDGTPYEVLTETDPRIASALRKLVAARIITKEELLEGMASSAGKPVKKALQGLTLGASAC